MAKGAITVKIDGQYDDKDINKAIKDLNALKSQAGPTAKGFDGLSASMKSIGVAAAAFGGFAVITDFLKSAMDAAIQDEKSMVALAKAMENVGAGSQTAGVEAFISKMMLATGVADDQLRPAFQKLVTATGDVTQAQGLLQTAMDVSAATGKDLNTVSLALAKAANGNIGALTRLGVPIDANIVKNKDFAAALDAVNQRFSGQAAAAADTYGGSLLRIQAAAGEAQESIGYALLGAVDNLATSFGGTGGVVEGITMFGEKMADIVTTIGDGVLVVGNLVSGFGGLVDALGKSVGATELWGSILSGVWQTVVSTVGGPLYQLGQMYQAGQEDAQGAAQATMTYGLSAARTAPLLASLAASEQATADAAAEAKEKMDALKASVSHFNSVISQSQARDDLRKSIADIDVALKGNSKSFKGVSDSAKENRDTLRTMLGDAANIALTWGQQTGASADEIDAKYKAMRKKIIAGFKAEGFSAEDIKAFMGKEGLWRTPAQDAVKSASTAATSVARPSFLVVGKQVAQGAAAGISQNGWMVAQAARIMMLNAKGAAQAAIDSNSPSKVFAAIGGDIVDGLVLGIKSKDQKTRDAATEMANAIVEKAQSIVDKWDEKLARLKDVLDTRKQELADAAKSVSQAIMGGINFATADSMTKAGENGEQVGMTFMEGLRAQAAQAVEFAKKVKELISMGLSQEGIQQVLAAGAVAGTSIAKELIAGGATAINDTNQLVASTQEAADEVGLLAANSWYGAGVASAQATYDGFSKNFGKGGPARNAMEGLMDRLAKSLERTTTVTVQTVYEAAGLDGKRAMGGTVAANKAYLVGEKGPEVLVMGSMSGSIIPNGDLPTASGSYGRSSSSGGNTYNINVSAGVGDPRQIGQQIVEYVTKFEKASGRVWAAA